ncbi:uncharacterized protein LOC133285271 isoform X2 [Gastrolobium bilobum]|uniref:uncharacterized protein LOC133285271 isoform X2 n=1 Tax=Gastrolobium bilobum TaxID=150636 RepID=UPI002AAFA8EC|nr:uncharacterized protein LOC133285271 isoform X2 [Gastrolobium bilobum]
MEDKYYLCIVAEMDRLWFHQIILFSEPTASVTPEPVEKPVPISESPSCSSSILSLPPLPDEETSTDESPSLEIQVSSESISLSLQDDSIDKKEETKERFARMKLLGNRIRSHSSSPSSQNRNRKCRKRVTTTRKLQKSMSCRTLGELELDEVKGFMDLGFIFKKENLCPRMMSVVPGLQRLEAWLIKRPDSPLLNLRIPKPSSSANMKKHLRFWAKTVASEINQE